MIKYVTITARALGVEKPKVAMIAPTEQVLPKVQSTVDAAILSKMGERGQIPGCIIEGPMALDVAVDKEAAEIKKMQSVVAGDADCLIFPNLESGNVFYKTNLNREQYWSEQKFRVYCLRVEIVLKRN